MGRIDRNAQVNNRTRRNWQRLNFATATTAIALNPSPTNALLSTGLGYGVFVDTSTIFKNGSTISVDLSSTGGLTATSSGIAVKLNSTGSLLTRNSSGADISFDIASLSAMNQFVLSVQSVGSSTNLTWQPVVLPFGTAIAPNAESTVFTFSPSVMLPGVPVQTLTLTVSNQPSTTAWMGPASGANAAPVFRVISTTDISGLLSTISTGIFPVVSTDVSSPFTGQAWYNSTTQRVTVDYSSTSTGHFPVIVFASSVSTSVQASTTALVLTPYSYTFPPNALNNLSTMVKIRADMSFTTANTNTYTVILDINGSTFTAIFIDTITTGQAGVIEVDLNLGVQSTGSSGQMVAVGKYVGTVAGAGVQGSLGVNAGTVDLTKAITIAWQVSAASTNANDKANMISADYTLM